MVRPLNQAALLSFCKDLGEEIVRAGADLPSDHPLQVELGTMTESDHQRVEFFLDGVLFEHRTGAPLRDALAAERARSELPSAQHYVADWQRREAARLATDRRAEAARTLVRRGAWIAFWAVVALVLLLDRSGALDRAAGGR